MTVLCILQLRKMGLNIHKYTVQCVLPWNLFNEKIYIFLWWWLVVVTAFSCLGFLVWCITLLPNSNKRFATILVECCQRQTYNIKVICYIRVFVKTIFIGSYGSMSRLQCYNSQKTAHKRNCELYILTGTETFAKELKFRKLLRQLKLTPVRW